MAGGTREPQPFSPVPWGLADLLLVAGIFLVALALSARLLGATDATAPGAVLAHLPAHALASAALVGLAWLRGPRALEAMGLVGAGFLRGLVVGVAQYLVFLVLWVVLVFFLYRWLLQALGASLPEQDALRLLLDARGTPALVWMLVVVVATGPLAEELFFRGMLQPLLCARLGTLWGLLAASAAFGLLHAPALYMLLPVGTIGLFLGFVRLRTGSVLVPYALHALHNGLTVGIYLAQPSLHGEVFQTPR